MFSRNMVLFIYFFRPRFEAEDRSLDKRETIFILVGQELSVFIKLKQCHDKTGLGDCRGWGGLWIVFSDEISLS